MKPGARKGGRRAAGVLAATLMVATILSGCNAPAAPVRLSVSVFQLRSDYAIRGAQIEVTNPSVQPLRVTSASFESSWFDGRMLSPSTPTQLLPHSTLDLRITLADPLCSAKKPVPVVHLRYLREDGSRGDTTVVPRIPFDSLAIVHGQDCSRVDFEKIVAIAVSPALRYDHDGATTGMRAALVDVTFTPTGAAGSVTLHSTEDTTLLAQREGTIRRIEQIFTAASPPQTITLDYVPASCLEHRVAEDKIGTLIPIRVDVGGYHDALFSIPVPPALKAELLDWVGGYCGW